MLLGFVKGVCLEGKEEKEKEKGKRESMRLLTGEYGIVWG